jgi:hypothetical protein
MCGRDDQPATVVVWYGKDDEKKSGQATQLAMMHKEEEA